MMSSLGLSAAGEMAGIPIHHDSQGLYVFVRLFSNLSRFGSLEAQQGVRPTAVYVGDALSFSNGRRRVMIVPGCDLLVSPRNTLV
jgi:hypothetical protein